eukprot:scaffold12009_cov61-Cyclotella_meneghiniana.AAC.6
MSYKQIQQPRDGRNRPWGRYKPASSTVTVSGCRDGANPKFLASSSYGVSSTSANRLSSVLKKLFTCRCSLCLLDAVGVGCISLDLFRVLAAGGAIAAAVTRDCVLEAGGCVDARCGGQLCVVALPALQVLEEVDWEAGPFRSGALDVALMHLVVFGCAYADTVGVELDWRSKLRVTSVWGKSRSHMHGGKLLAVAGSLESKY